MIARIVALKQVEGRNRKKERKKERKKGKEERKINEGTKGIKTNKEMIKREASSSK